MDLHAYVDGELDATRRADVEAHLADHPDDCERVQHWRDQIQAMHRQYDDVLNEPIPLRLMPVSNRSNFPRAIAAGIVCVACGGLAGWYARDLSQARSLPAASFANEALVAHALYVTEKRHPVEVPAAQEAHLIAWLSKRLDAPIRAPNLQVHGFSLLGGRLLPGDDAPMAQLMYESAAGARLTLTVKHAIAPQADTAFKILEKDGASVFYWIDQQFGYALSGDVDKARLLAIAQSVEGQLRRP
jgi:anti-sigma factor RsiW